jgi:hypothetical protein
MDFMHQRVKLEKNHKSQMDFVLSIVNFKWLCDIVFMKSDILAWRDNIILYRRSSVR